MPAGKKTVPKNRAAKKTGLTVPDLVLLSLLAEQPMHGYQANLELERRQVQAWAGVSRPQVYYSLEKLARLGLIAETGDHEPALVPERRSFPQLQKAEQLSPLLWNGKTGPNQRDHPPFLTWMALSWQASPATTLNNSTGGRNSWKPNFTVNRTHCVLSKKKSAMIFMNLPG